MIVQKFKVKAKPSQYAAIDEAIRTAQFVQNKALRYWMAEEKVGKYDLSKLCKQLAQKFPFAAELNSMARQASAERAWAAISRFYDNCKKGIKPVGYPKFKKFARSVEYKTSGWKLTGPKRITFTIKRVRLVRRADGYYCQFCIKVNRSGPQQPTGNAIGRLLWL